MFAALSRVLFKIRVYLGAVRAGIYGLAAVAATWILVLPASPDEIDRLNLQQVEGLPAENLRYYRMAKLLLLVGTDRMYEMVAEQTGGEVTANEVRFGVVLAAEGFALRESPTDNMDVLPTDESTAVTAAPAAREDIGAKFVSARTN